MGDLDGLVHTVAALGLPGTAHRPPAEPLAGPEWSALVRRVQHDRLTGLLCDAVADGTWPATPEQRSEIERIHGSMAAYDVMLERMLLDVVRRLDRAGIDMRVLKGPGLAHTIYPDPTLRTFVDVDVLVRPAALDDAIRTLGDAGFKRLYPDVRPGFAQRFGKGACLRGPDGREVDLHRMLATGVFGLRVPSQDLFEHPTPFRLGGTELLTLGRTQAFLHACYHAVLGDLRPRTVPLRDLAQLAYDEAVPVDDLLDRARRWRGEVVVAAAVRHAWERLGLDDRHPLHRWAVAYEPDPRDARALRAYTERRSATTQALVTVRELRGLRNKGAFLFGHLVPSPEFVHQDAAHSYLGWWRRGLTRLVGWKAG